MLTVSLLGMVAFHFLGMGDVAWVNSLMFGLCVCVSSTVVLTRVLGDNRVLQTPTGHTALGWLVVEDMFTIVLLVLMPAIFGGQELGPALGMMAVKLTLLVVVVALFGRKVIKQTLTYISRHCSDELFTLAVLVCALGIAVLSATVFNASMEFGAFLSGMVVGQSKFASRAASDALPMRDAFAVLFFVSVGMGFHIGGLVEYWPLALATLAICMLVKPMMAAIMVRIMGKPMRLSLMVGGSLSQIGEFSFILATLIAGTYHLLPMEAVNVITGVAIISITLNAALYRFVPVAVHQLEEHGIGVVPENADAVAAPADDRYRILLVGYGPCGELVSHVLRRHDMDVVVLEMNIDTVNKLHEAGLPAIHGDASNRTILRMAGVDKAKAIIISSAAAPAVQIAAAARGLNPAIRVVAHTNYIRIARTVTQAGDAQAFAGEAEVALAMTSYMLRALGATEEQVARERSENRRRLMGEAG